MIELRNEKITVKKHGTYCRFEVFIEDSLFPELNASRCNDTNEVGIQIDDEFNFQYLIEVLGKCKIETLVCYNKNYIPYMIYGNGDYQWEKLYFLSPMIFLEKKDKNCTIGLSFFLGSDNVVDWTYEYSVNHVLRQLFLINHGKVDIIEEITKYGYLFKIQMKKEFTTTLLASYNELKKAIYEVEQELYNRLESFKWKEDYHTKESKFTKEVMIPLLKKMKYKNVRYNHGTDEYGRDVIFSEINKFQEEIFYGIQVKAGDISGGANSQIDILISQLDDAFDMPFKSLAEENKRYLSFFIIAISGHFKKNAKEKILEKVKKWNTQNVFFWDKDKIEDLIGTYWKAD